MDNRSEENRSEENRIEAIVHTFGEEMERIVFNSNGKAKTMDLAKAWLRARLEELVQEVRAESQGYEATKIEEGKDARRAEMQICRN